jgi:hypothetical protein
MAEFSGKIISAQYIDAEYSMIKVTYEHDGMPVVYNLDANPDHHDYQDLLAEGWTQEKIIEETAEVKKAQSAAFNVEVHAAAKLMVDELLAKEKENLEKIARDLDIKGSNLEDLDRNTREKTQNMIAEVWTHIVHTNTDKDTLFKFKLWLLEQDFVKDSSKEEKSAIRKAERVTQLFSLIDDLIK